MSGTPIHLINYYSNLVYASTYIIILRALTCGRDEMMECMLGKGPGPGQYSAGSTQLTCGFCFCCFFFCHVRRTCGGGICRISTSRTRVVSSFSVTYRGGLGAKLTCFRIFSSIGGGGGVAATGSSSTSCKRSK